MKYAHALLLTAFIMACNVQKNTYNPDGITMEEEWLDTVMVTASRTNTDTLESATFNPSATRLFDLVHMDLEIAIDWEKEKVLGLADLTLRPFFYPQDTLILDAKNLSINSIKIGDKALMHVNTGLQVLIPLDKKYTRQDSFTIRINYTAQPSLGRVGGVGDDQGLYFINSSGNNPDKLQQIWSQGETENNSRWFPTIDKPNERYTHKITLVVDQQYQTLSNGYLASTEILDFNQRKDTWIMDDPHAPYLTMIAIGDFAVVKDSWRDIPLMYYVEKPYRDDAQKIFNNTPEMLDFFGDYVGVEYPWDQYAQIVVQDFVAGAMENTTAVTFADFVQRTSDELLDSNNDDIVAHEMFHHWFGDYVTCESWANLTLNEGFANYSEYLWIQHQYGQDEADKKRYDEMQGYFSQANFQGTHPLIHYAYTDKEMMFDAHSYNKGGLVLHMLRHQLGEDAFRKSLQMYLQNNAYTAVEADELRMAFEDVTGVDLLKFFDQWYFSSGHPELDINYTIEDGTLQIKVEQMQSMENGGLAVFEIPLQWELHFKDGTKTDQRFFMNKRKQAFTIPVDKSISWINFDPNHTLLATYTENRDQEEYETELRLGSTFDQLEALDALEFFNVSNESYLSVFQQTEYDYAKALIAKKIPFDQKSKTIFIQEVMNKPNSLASFVIMQNMIEQPNLLDFDSLYPVLANTLSPRNTSILITLLAYANPEKVLPVVRNLDAKRNLDVIIAKTAILGGLGDSTDLAYMIQQWGLQKDFALDFIAEQMAQISSEDTSGQLFESLYNEVYVKESYFDRKNSYVIGLGNFLENSNNPSHKKLVLDHLKQIKANESNSSLQDTIQSYLEMY